MKFQSAASIFSVCPYCRSMLVRKDLSLESLGKMAILQEDMSPLQIGTQGRFEKVSFSVIGRLKIRWDDGYWNEWCLLMDDARTGWLAEAQGFYMVSFAHEIPKDLPPASELTTGSTLVLDRQPYEVDDRRKCWCEGSEGELPFKAPQGKEMFNVDLTGPGEKFASLSFTDEGCELYVGRYVEFEELRFTQLRPLNGW
ncbi:MAG: DUF4178 domain-containing protein [bacterium]